MSEHSGDRAIAHFGRDGMRRIGVPASYARGLSEEARTALREQGVPVHVAPYFTAAGETDGLTLGMFLSHRGLLLQDERADWLRLGTDELAQICMEPGGAIRAVFVARPEPSVFVSSDLNTFVTSLAVLDRCLPLVAAATSLPAAAAVFADLYAELRQIDAPAFESREAWWPRVLDDTRHTLTFPFSTAFEYIDGSGDKQIATAETGAGMPHPEEILWQRLSAAGVASEQIRRVYCELEPCMMPGHYCAAWMQTAFPQAEFTHSFDYGDTADSREEGLKALITYTARQAAEQ